MRSSRSVPPSSRLTRVIPVLPEPKAKSTGSSAAHPASGLEEMPIFAALQRVLESGRAIGEARTVREGDGK